MPPYSASVAGADLVSDDMVLSLRRMEPSQRPAGRPKYEPRAARLGSASVFLVGKGLMPTDALQRIGFAQSSRRRNSTPSHERNPIVGHVHKARQIGALHLGGSFRAVLRPERNCQY